MTIYDPKFYEIIRPGVRRSTKALVPTMADIYAAMSTRAPEKPSVVDVGCGEGWWAREWREQNYAVNADGIDGPWPGAGDALTQYDHEGLRFIPMQLDRFEQIGWPAAGADPLYDVALCLEVAEHLGNPDHLLEWLRKLAPVVFFSAAVPGQPGAGHVSCRWQADWAESFAEAGWFTHDPRPMIWGDDRIEWWYRQNLFVAWDPTCDDVYNAFGSEPIMSIVHPDMWAVRHECR